MSGLPVISGQECVKALQKIGYYFKRQTGSHFILRKDEPFSQIVVPNNKQLDRGTLRSIIRQADLSVIEFVNLL